MERTVKLLRKNLTESVAGKNVFVGLSGGVDSSVTAALLCEAGANVTGVFIKGWYPPGMPCTWAADRRDAMRVAAHLRIPFHTLDASKEYKEGVIDYLVREYKAGRTPNPDVMCNREVKFAAFYQYARGQGAHYIATGHYTQSFPGSSASPSSKDAVLLRGVDENKDQSYFLWAVSKDALLHTLFPLGTLQKKVVRELAADYALPTAQKRDSQGICFLGSISIEDFLREEFESMPGEARTQDGDVVGQHTGVFLSTLGQRIALKNAQPGPWYVLSKDIKTNVLIVSRELRAAARSDCIITETNWMRMPVVGTKYEAQYRYHGPRIVGTYDSARNAFIPAVAITEPVANGQSLVLYDGEECMGGGIIG